MLPARTRRRRAALICSGLLLLAVVVGTATKTAFFMIPVLAAFFGYALWRIQFTCPRCSTPYLYDQSGFIASARFFGKACRKCGLSHDELFTKSYRT